MYYRALIAKNARYDGLFYVGVKTTGVLCRPTCPAKKPKFEHCEFFETAQQGILASYRPCKRCRPLSHPDLVSEVVQKLVEAIDKNPEKRWKNQDLQKLSINSATARRQFKKWFGMTFIEYARARRIGIAMKEIRAGHSVINAQLSAGYESSSGFRDAFSRILGAAPTLMTNKHILKAAWIDTPLGPMIAIADENSLYLLEFIDRRGLEREVERLRKKIKCAILPGYTQPIHSIENELALYFAGKLKKFSTPILMLGSLFQKAVWKLLREIPYGKTCSYADIAKLIRKPLAYRAVARANGTNQISLVIPCHRVVNANGNLGGYGGGLTRKAWLIKHEKQHE